MKYPKLRELKEAITALIKGPYTSGFPYEPHVPADRFRGKPEFEEEECVGCGACANVCPARAIEIQDIGAERCLTYRWDVCIFCGQCEANCLTEKGIVLTKEFDFAGTGSREESRQQIKKELVMCDLCGDVVAPYDQLLWVAKQSGPLLFSNTSLLNIYYRHKSMSLGGEPETEGMSGGVDRSVRVEVLCPACRREAVMKS